MPYPKELLSGGEEIVLEFKPHWSALWQEGLATLAYIVILIIMLGGDHTPWLFLIVTGFWAWFGLRGYLRWTTTEHVLTNERFIFRAGWLHKVGYEIPLETINDVAFRQRAFERVLGVGDLLIETASTNGQSRLNNIPHPESVKQRISEVRKGRTHDVSRGGAAPATSTTSAAEQLAILGDLLDQGKITQDEYDGEKRKLLG